MIFYAILFEKRVETRQEGFRYQINTTGQVGRKRAFMHNFYVMRGEMEKETKHINTVTSRWKMASPALDLVTQRRSFKKQGQMSEPSFVASSRSSHATFKPTFDLRRVTWVFHSWRVTKSNSTCGVLSEIFFVRALHGHTCLIFNCL